MALEFTALKKALEAILFVTKKPLSPQELSQITEVPEEQVVSALNELTLEYENRGLTIVPVAHGYILGTNPVYAEYVDRLINSKVETTLSPQALETLSIIAYKQPMTRVEIERIRGLYSDGVLETLLTKKLIEEKGRGKGMGRPILYGTTIEFLRHFGLRDLNELPALPQNKIEQEDLFRTVLAHE